MYIPGPHLRLTKLLGRPEKSVLKTCPRESERQHLGLKTTVLNDKTRIQRGLDRLEQCAGRRWGERTRGAGVLCSQNLVKILKNKEIIQFF